MLTGLFFAAIAVTGSVEDQVRCAELAFSRSVQEQNIEAFTAMVDEDARFTGGETLRGKQEIADGWTPFFQTDAPRFRWAPDNIEVLETGDLALSQGPWEMILVGESGEDVVRTGRFFSVWRRDENGRWSVIFDGGTPPRPADGDPFASLDYDPATVCTDDKQ
jgi:ketosteroid isomerase-like protein